MNQQENTIPVSLNEPQTTAGQSLYTEPAEVRKHYFHQHLLMNPDTVIDLSNNAGLLSLKRRTVRFVEMLALLEHSCVEEIPVLQKACFSYLIEDTVPRKERQRIIEAWTSWSDFLFALNRYRSLASVFLKYHQRMIEEIESLLTPVASEASSELQATNQEGGI